MAHDIAIVSEDQLRALVGLDTNMIDLTERAFVALAKGGVIMLTRSLSAGETVVIIVDGYRSNYEGNYELRIY